MPLLSRTSPGQRVVCSQSRWLLTIGLAVVQCQWCVLCVARLGSTLLNRIGLSHGLNRGLPHVFECSSGLWTWRLWSPCRQSPRHWLAVLSRWCEYHRGWIYRQANDYCYGYAIVTITPIMNHSGLFRISSLTIHAHFKLSFYYPLCITFNPDLKPILLNILENSRA